MKILVKQIQGREVTVEVDPSTSILQMKQQIEKKLLIPVDAQSLLFLGRALVDELPVSFYPHLKDGTKLNLAIKRGDGLYDISMREFKKLGLNDNAAAKAANRLMVTVRDKFDQLSMDDVDKLALDFMTLQDRARRPEIHHPDNQRPATQCPDNQHPDSQRPDNQRPDNQRPDNQRPDNQRSKIHCSDIQRSDIQRPDTQNSDIQHPDTQPPNTQCPDIREPTNS